MLSSHAFKVLSAFRAIGGWRPTLKSLVTIVALAWGASLLDATTPVSQALTGFGHRYLWRFPVIHSGAIEEAFLGSMARHYGPDWLRWMPDAVIAEHWYRFPAAFGHGPEAAFLQWMNHRFGLGWQAWVPSPVVHQCWCQFCGH